MGINRKLIRNQKFHMTHKCPNCKHSLKYYKELCLAATNKETKMVEKRIYKDVFYCKNCHRVFKKDDEKKEESKDE